MGEQPPIAINHAAPWLITGISLLAAAFLFTASWPSLRLANQRTAARLVQDGRQAQGHAAELDFMLARALDPHNQTAATEHARLKLAAGQTASALRTLDAAGQGTEATRLRLRAQLDLGQTTSAAASAGQLLSQSTDPADQVLAALAFNAAGRGQDLSLLISHVSSPEVLQRIQRTSTSQLGLGVELYATGLLQVSQEVLVKLADSNIRDLILGQITLAQHSQKSYVDARGYFQTVLDDNPANLEARRGLIASLRGLGDNAAAARQTQLLEQLQAGTP